MSDEVTTQIKLSVQKDKGFKKSVGFCSNNGSRKQKTFWLGKDRKIAEILALRIISEWQILKAEGYTEWPEQKLQEIDHLKSKLNSYGNNMAFPLLTEQTSKNGKKRNSILTYFQAIDYYINSVIPNLSFSEQWSRDLSDRLQATKEGMGNLALTEVDAEQIEKFVNYYKKRPKNKHNKKPISFDTVKAYTKAARRLLKWLYKNDYWHMPKDFDELFIIDKRHFPLTSKEKLQAVNEVKVFTIDELCKIWEVAGSLHFMQNWILYTLNTGGTQTEISNLLIGEVFFNGIPDENIDYPCIQRIRDKQKVKTRWKLWDETEDMLRREICPDVWDYKEVDGIYYCKPPYGIWRKYEFQHSEYYKSAIANTAEQKITIANRKPTDTVFVPVSYFQESTWTGKRIKIDRLSSAWYRLRRKSPEIKLSFKHLRKTGANMIKKIAGRTISHVYLSDIDNTTGGKHYTNDDFDKLAEALDIMRIQLQPMFDVDNDIP